MLESIFNYFNKNKKVQEPLPEVNYPELLKDWVLRIERYECQPHFDLLFYAKTFDYELSELLSEDDKRRGLYPDCVEMPGEENGGYPYDIFPSYGAFIVNKRDDTQRFFVQDYDCENYIGEDNKKNKYLEKTVLIEKFNSITKKPEHDREHER